MYFNEIASIQRRMLIDVRQAYEAWSAADQEMRHRFAGSMRWQKRGAAEYLMRKVRSVEKSLGRRQPETERTYDAFIQGRAAAKDRLAGLVAALQTQAAIARSVGVGRVPSLTARVFRALDEARILGHIRIVGTNALYAYEALAGIHFTAETLATGDVDLLFDARRALRIIVPEPEPRTVLGLLRKLDHSFKLIEHKPYTVANADGFMVDLIYPQASPPWRSPPGVCSLAEDDIVPSAVQGLQWLVNSAPVEALVIDDRGYPAPIIVPDPRVWAAHKAWLSGREDRDAIKRRRDGEQALAVIQVLRRYLPQFSLADGFGDQLPKALRQSFAHLLEQVPAEETREDGWPRPEW